MSGEPLLRVRDLRVERGGVRVLELEALDLAEGAVLALLGPNGSGKTTLLQTLAGLQAPASGLIAFRGRPLDAGAYRRRVTMVFQAPLLFDTSVRSNLESGLRLHGIPAAERRARVAEEALRFGVTPLLDRSARNLSGGEAQRVSLARAFALRPEILFLDEPFAALDPPTREALLDDLARALGDTGTTAVLATHDREEALRLADGIAVLRGGRLVQTGPPREVINRPADAFVAGFMGMGTLLEGRVLAQEAGEFRVACQGREIVVPGAARPGDPVRLGVRPEHVTLSIAPAPSSARNTFPGRITRIVPKDPFFRVELDCGFPLSAYVTALSLREMELECGTEVLASFKATAVQVFPTSPIG